MNAFQNTARPSAASRPKVSRAVEYIPPSEEVVERFATRVCRKLAEKRGLNGLDGETKQGFTDFIKLVVKIETKHRNPGEHHGSR